MHPSIHPSSLSSLPTGGMTMTESENRTGNILGDPRKSLIAMVVPIAIGMIVQSLNNFVDAIWVSGIGTAALAATGVVFPFFFILIGIGNGLGVGASQAIARRIGLGDREGASRVAAQVLVIGVLVGFAITVVFALFPEPIFRAAGAGAYLEEVMAYGVPIMVCAPIYMLSFIFSALLRSEGDARKSMVIQVAGVAVHMVMDPVLIFGLGLGVGGAAIASALSALMAAGMAVRYYRRGEMYVDLSFKGFRFDRALDADILRVGFPASLEMILLSISTLFMNIIIEMVDPVNGVAIYTTGWRILDLLMVLAVSFGSALVPISAAAYGQRSFERIKAVYVYALKYGVALMVVIAAVAMVAAPVLVHMFTYTGSTAELSEEMTRFVRIGCLFLPFSMVGILTSSVFQSVGKGLWSMCATSLRNFLRVPLCYALAAAGSLTLVWWGVTLGEVIGTTVVAVAGVFALRFIRRQIESMNGVVGEP